MISNINLSNKKFKLDGKEFFIIKENNKFYILPALCPHRKGPLYLSKKIENGKIECTLHNNKFSIDKLNKIFDYPFIMNRGKLFIIL